MSAGRSAKQARKPERHPRKRHGRRGIPSPAPVVETWGVGACPEAQADGVPCTTPHRSCEVCEKARPTALLRAAGHLC
jgi:hypothetical protein